jgi:hypothetical protein
LPGECLPKSLRWKALLAGSLADTALRRNNRHAADGTGLMLRKIQGGAPYLPQVACAPFAVMIAT